LTEHLDPKADRWLRKRATVVCQSGDDPEKLRRELADAEGLIVRTYTRVDAELLEVAPLLRVVGRAGVGLDNIDLEACRKCGVRVVHTPEANTQAVVEYVWGLILDAVRPRPELSEYVLPQVFHRLRREMVGRQLSDLTLGVLGMGRIGRRVAEVAGTIGLRVLCNDLLTEAELGWVSGHAGELVGSSTLWAESDILTIHVDGRESNRHLIDSSVLEALKPECILINTSRGFVIDSWALAAWARSAESRGGVAILDVHAPEPPTEDYPLFGLQNIRLLPHLASRTDRAMRNMSDVVYDVVSVLRGQEPEFAALSPPSTTSSTVR
jgi:phosphoglycerate dehydrogenase-like enzyme